MGRRKIVQSMPAGAGTSLLPTGRLADSRRVIVRIFHQTKLIVTIKRLAFVLGMVTAIDVRAEWDLTLFVGQMTDNSWEETINPGKTDFIDSYLIGVAAGRDFASKGPFRFGIEGQIVGHFGTQDLLEFNVPIYARYLTPEDWRIFKSFCFGIGLSYSTQIPQTEINRDGESSHILFYWMAEIEFYLPTDELSLVLRLHHRSDGYGVFATDSGSNALVLGLRHQF